MHGFGGDRAWDEGDGGTALILSKDISLCPCRKKLFIEHQVTKPQLGSGREGTEGHNA